MKQSNQSAGSDGISEEQDMEKLRRENAELLTEIAELCDQNSEDEVENIFLLGMPGSGKSALINTVIKAVSGKYIARANVGSGFKGSKTLTLQRFKHCGVRKNCITAGRKDIVSTILPKLPTIFDAAGINDMENYENPKAVEEILEMFFGGFIPPNTRIDALENLQKENYIGCLSAIFTNSKPEWKMTKVVFVHSCTTGRVPSGLIRCLDTIRSKTDPETAQSKYPVGVFVVITKCDLVKESNPENNYISVNEFKKIEDCLAEEFNIKGALRENMIHWTSYSDITVPDSPCIDNTALKFLKMMMMTPTGNIGPSVPIITRWGLWKIRARKILKEMMNEFTGPYVFICVLMIIVAILVYKLLSADPGSKDTK